MAQDSPMPSLEQFVEACRREFSFLRELGYAELGADPDEGFSSPSAGRTGDSTRG